MLSADHRVLMIGYGSNGSHNGQPERDNYCDFFHVAADILRTQGLIVLRYSFLIHFLKALNRNDMLFLSPINEIYRKRVILLKYMCVNGDIYSRSGIG